MADGAGQYHDCNCNLKIRKIAHLQDEASGDDDRIYSYPWH